MTEKDRKQVTSTHLYGEIRDILEDYQQQMEQSSLSSSLQVDIAATSDWVVEKLNRALELKTALDTNRHTLRDKKTNIRVETLCEEVAHRRASVDGLIRRSYHFLAADPNTLTYSDLTLLEANWKQLEKQALVLEETSDNIYIRNHESTPVGSNSNSLVSLTSSEGSCCSHQGVDLYFVTSQKHKVTPLYDRFPTKEKKIHLDKNYVNAEESLLKKNGRKKVPKLSRLYRIFIKGQVAQHRRSKQNIECGVPGFESQSSISLDSSSDFSVPYTSPYQVSEISQHISEGGVDDVGLLHTHRKPNNNLRHMKGLLTTSNQSLIMENMDIDMDAMDVDIAGTLNGEASTSPPPQVVPHSPSSPTSRLGTRSSPSHRDESPYVSKRRKMNFDDSPSLSPPGSPTSCVGAPLDLRYLSMNQTFDGETTDTSNISSPGGTPPEQRKKRQDFRGRLKKEDLWAAIESDYQYLMDEEIIETCKSTGSDLSWESDDLSTYTAVSFTEFTQQYKELTDWLNQIQLVTQRQSSSLSEKYINQTYHEEMLSRTPRRKVFNDYAKQLMRRHPHLKEEITTRLQHLNNHWLALQKDISPGLVYQDEQSMLKDLEEDLNSLRRWLHSVEGTILPLCLKPEWSIDQLKQKLQDHQVLQRDIESHSKIVSAVLKLCERLKQDRQACSNEGERDSLQLVALNLERRWHAIWLQSLEWQCRLEEAIAHGKGPTKLTRERSGLWPRYCLQSPGLAEESADSLLDEEKSEYTEDENGLDSDACCFDTIPFSESEYEKIVDDTGVQTDDSFYGKVTSDLGVRHDESHGSMDTGIDSALGRSVSDHSINTDNQAVCHSAIKLSDQLTQAFEKKVTQIVTVNQSIMRAAQDPKAPDNKLSNQGLRTILRSENHDVGYSSESHSNEEVDYPMGQPTTSSQMVRGSDGGSKETSNSSDENAVVRRQPKENTGSGNNNQGSPLHSKWRHSMTSAYDTSSNCSELVSAYDLDSPVDLSVDNTTTSIDANDNLAIQNEVEKEVRQAVSNLMTSPFSHVYKLTTIETDSELSSAADSKPVNIQGDFIRSGADTDAESELSRSLELPYDDVPLRYHADDGDGLAESTPKCSSSMPRSRLKLEKLFGPAELAGDHKGKVVENERNVSERVTQYREKKLSVEGSHALFEMEPCNPLVQKSDHYLTEIDSGVEQSKATLTHDECNGNTLTEQSKFNDHENNSLKKLVQQAELISQDNNLGSQLQQSQWYKSQAIRSKKHRSKHKRTHDESFASTDGSAVPTTGDSAPSSCDASSEGTASESESDCSASSDVDQPQNNSVLLVHSTDSTLNGSQSLRTSPVKDAGSLPRHFLANGQGIWSMSDQYGLDPSQFSISESAINELRKQHGGSQPDGLSPKLRRTTSETSPLSVRRFNTPPRKQKRRRFKGSASDEAKEGSNGELGRYSPSPSKAAIHSTPVSASRSVSTVDGNSPYLSATEDEAVSVGTPKQAPILNDVNSLELRQQILRASSPKPIKGSAKMPAGWKYSDMSGSELERRKQDQVVPHGDTDDTDPVSHSMNSTVESFSENAWDPYQADQYACISSDPGEEKLDPSHLQGEWEHNADYEEEFDYDDSYRTHNHSVTSPENKTSRPQTKEKRVLSTKSSTGQYLSEASRTQDDSDSDLDDFHDVIEESRKAILFTKSTLTKFRKDKMDTGIFLDPAEYVEPLATCQTNIRCLEVVLETLQSEVGLENVGEEDINHIHDMISEWTYLGELAVQRQHQAQQLTAVFKEMVSLDTGLREIREGLQQNSFDDVTDLEASIKCLQGKSMEWGSLKSAVGSVYSSVSDFRKNNPEVQMENFCDEVDRLQSELTEMAQSLTQHISEIQSKLISWYDFNETHKELEYLVAQERRQLQYVELAEQGVEYSQEGLQDNLHDLQILNAAFGEYQTKLQKLRESFGSVSPLCSEYAQMQMRADIAMLDNEVSSMWCACEARVNITEEKLTHVISAEAGFATMSTVRSSSRSQACQVNSVPAIPEPRHSSRLMRLFKATLPLQLALVVLFGLMALMGQDSCGNYNIAGLVFSPQLRYVRGPPPT